MNLLIPISGYANTYRELCTKIAEAGEFYNVIEENSFVTYMKTDSTQVGDTLETTDVICWYPNKAELESNVKPKDGDVYITGVSEPYTRWKAEVNETEVHWEEDGLEEKKILKNYKTVQRFGIAHVEPEEGVYYTVGKEAPYKVYGVVSEWEPVGTFITYLGQDIDRLKHKPEKSNPGEIALIQGMFYLYNGEEWVALDIKEPIRNVYKHTYTDGEHIYLLREGAAAGTLEFYAPRA